MTHLKSSVLQTVPGILHGFGTFEEPIPDTLEAYWKIERPQWKQVHGTSIAHVQTRGQACGEVDSLYTRAQSIPIGVVTADCVPILMANKSGSTVAAIHAGWRGTRAHILRVLWQELIKSGEKPQEWVAAIGPAIGPCCYEVSEELATDFFQEFAEFGSDVAVPHNSASARSVLDLPAINAAELKKLGLGQVDVIRACTRCSDNPRFHSYRREGSGTRQYSMIMRIS